MARARTVLLAVVPLLLGLLAGACAPDREVSGRDPGAVRAAAAPAESAGAADLAVVAVRPGLDAEGMFLTFLEPVIDAPVPARSAGVVEEVRVHEGQRVARGQVLARLEDEEQRLEVEYTGALSAQAEAELDRAEKGAAAQWLSKQSLDAARAKAQAMRVDLELAKLAYARRTLRAPVAGVVWQVRAEPHRLVQANDVLFRVTDPALLRADLLLPIEVTRRLAPGATVTLVPAADPTATAIPAPVRRVSPLADPATGRVHVQVETAKAPPALVGQSLQARLVAPAGGDGPAGAGGGAILPRNAYLERDGDRMFVWRVRDGTARRIEIVVGSSRPDGYEVLSGLAAGDLVCAAGAAPPADGARVRARLVAEATP